MENYHWAPKPGVQVAVVILNWNGLKFLQRYLPLVVSNTPDAEIVVADNGSTDESGPWVQQQYPSVRWLPLGQNHGFAEGYNQALAPCPYPFAVLLNSDVETPQGWLPPLMARMLSQPTTAAIQPKILAVHNPHQFEFAGASGGFMDYLGYPYCRGRLFEECELDHKQYDKAMPCFWATGACMLVRLADYRAAGGLDGQFFAHMEEIDLCWRLAHLGKEVWVEPASHVYHVGGGTLHKSNPRKTFLNFRNSMLMLYKNLPSSRLFLGIFIRLVLDGIAGIQFLTKGRFADCWAIVRAHFAFYGLLPQYSKLRKAINPPPNALGYTGILKRSVVWRHFGMGVRRWSEL